MDLDCGDIRQSYVERVVRIGALVAGPRDESGSYDYPATPLHDAGTGLP